MTLCKLTIDNLFMVYKGITKLYINCLCSFNNEDLFEFSYVGSVNLAIIKLSNILHFGLFVL